MNTEFFNALDMLENEKGISKEYMLERIEAALVSAFKREQGGNSNVKITLDPKKKDVKVFALKEIVEVVEDPALQISLEDAKKISKRYALGGTAEVKLDPKNFRRLSATTAKQVIIQGIREAERGMMIKEYENKKEEVITATVQRVDPVTGTVRRPKVLNLFAYTGAASLAARCAGADTTHLDSVRQVVTWAKGNMESSNLDNIRWVVEDALKFAKREAKRGNLYNGLIMDPPAYGHGPDGEKWKLDELLYEFLQEVARILAPEDAFMVLNLYSNGYSAMLGDTAVRSAFGMLGGKGKGELSCGELLLKDNFGKAIPLSVFSRLVR